MTFKEQTFATLIGTTSGFLFSLALFWVKEYFSSSKQRTHLLKNLHYEFAYNINLFKKYHKQITECMEAVSADKRNVFLPLDYNFVASYFSLQFYREGLISKYLHYEDMKRWNDFVTRLSVGNERFLLDSLDSWGKSTLDKERIFDLLKFEREQINYAIEMTEYLTNKIPKG